MRLHVCVVVFIHLTENFKLAGPGSVFPAFCHATFHHALITCYDVSRVGYFALCIMIRIQLILVEWKSRNITKCYVMQASWWILPITFKIKKCEWTTVQPWFNDELKDWPNFVYHDEILLHRGSVPLFYNNWGREQCLLYQGFHHNYRGSLYQRSTVMSDTPLTYLSTSQNFSLYPHQGFSQKGVQPSYGRPFLEETQGKFT